MKHTQMMIIIISSLFSFSSLSYAVSGGAGNGGDVVYCPNRVEKVFTLDTYGAQKLQLHISLKNSSLSKQTWRSMVNTAVSRLRKKDLVTASRLYDYAMEMVNDFEKFQEHPGANGRHVYLGNDVIAAINDSFHESLPEDCELEPRQIVFQRAPRFRRDKRYHFSKSLWDQMSLQEQSMMILHEAWYRIMIENGATDSIATRYMNGLIASEEFSIDSFSNYIEELKGTEIKSYIILNNSFAVKDKEIVINLRDHTLTFTQDRVCAPNFKVNMSIKETYTVFNRSQNYLKNIKFQEVCFKNSRLTSMILPTKVVNSNVTLRLPFHQINFARSLNTNPAIFFHPNGKLSHMSGIEFKNLVEMYYVCNNKNSYTNSKGCESGPFINHDTTVKKPLNIKFNDTNERPVNFFL